MKAIYLKELKSCFKSLTGWLFLAVFTFFGGLYFSLNNIFYGSPYISNTLVSLLIVLLFLVPLLTMRSFSEEKKLKTDQLLLTAPIRVSSIVLGKFFAMATVMLIATLIFSTGIILLVIYGSIPVGETIMSLVGFFLYGCICIAVGMFLSSVTEHQFIAAILTYGVFVFMILVPSFCSILFGSDSVIMSIINVIDIITPFDMLFSGIIVVSDVTYIFSAIFIFLMLTYFMVGRNSFQPQAEGKKRLLTGAIGTAVIVAAIIALNIGVKFLPAEYMQFDMTKNGWYSITDETKNLLDTLEEEITIYVIGEENEVDDIINMYLNSYQKYSNKINVEYKSLDLYPTFYLDYSNTYLDPSSMVIVMGDMYRVINYAECYVVEYGYDASYQMTSMVTGIDVEGQITSAIGSMLAGEERLVYFLDGHNEVDISQSLLSRFIKGGYTVRTLSLLHETDVPEDAVTLVINGPEKDLSPDEVAAVKRYVERGGNLIMMASTDINETPNYDALFEEYGVTMTEGSVVEGDYTYVYNQVPFAILPDNQVHDITAPIYGERYAFLIQSRGLVVQEDATSGMEVYPLFTTSDSAYAKVLSSDATLAFEEGNDVGPFALGVCTEVYLDNGDEATVTMIGSAAFLYEDFDMVVANANSDVFIAAVNYGSDCEVVTTIPAKNVEPDYVLINSTMALVYMAVIVLVIPVALIVSGIIIVVIRRKK